jgi:hypothetical protein
MKRKYKVAVAYEEGFTIVVDAVTSLDAEKIVKEFVDECVRAEVTYNNTEMQINDTVHRDAHIVEVIDISER